MATSKRSGTRPVKAKTASKPAPAKAAKPPKPAKRDRQRRLVIVSGLSGAGKATVLKTLEDMGYYSVDNLPVGLIAKFAELTRGHENIARGAIGIDIREGGLLRWFPEVLEQLRRTLPVTLLFLEADTEVLARRYSETRRPHPLGTDQGLVESLEEERRHMQVLRGLADHIIDTSQYNVHQLREEIERLFGSDRDEKRIAVQVTSFGYRNGVPSDSDLVFDVRFLPNPNYIPEMKPLTGKSAPVQQYIMGYPQTREFLDRTTDLLIYLLPHYIREGKSYLNIAIGCTGGQHRSVAMSEEIADRLAGVGYRVRKAHRDMPRK